MRALASLTAIAVLVTSSLAHVVPLISKRDGRLKVELSQAHATEVRAVMTNMGSEPLKLLDYGTLMDKNPVQKLNVFRDGVEVGFTGIDARYKMFDFSEDAFTTLAPGEAFTSVINIAALHEVSGGDYTVSTAGAIPYAALGTTEIDGSITYASNVLPLTLSDDDIGMVARAVPFLEVRTNLRSCSSTEEGQHVQALGQCVAVAGLAAQAARFGDINAFEAFFKTTDESVRELVAARFQAVSLEASTSSSGATTYLCEDRYGYCSDNTLAYALPSRNLIANCGLYYTLSSLSGACGDQDQTTTALHEFTHTPGVFGPGTQDLAYGLRAALRLSTDQALMNADSFALYANAVVNNCSFVSTT